MVDFDAQSGTFDRRAGLPAAVVLAIVQSLFELARLTSGNAATPRSRVLDVGCGTGELGVELVALGVDYVGLDASSEMLEVFRGRAARRQVPVTLVHADGRQRWPVTGGSVSLVFGSRSLHFLPAAHVATEAFRVAAPSGSVLLVGRVVRDPESPRERIRRRMRQILRELGHEGRRGERHAEELVRECVARGARALPARRVAEWITTRSPREALNDWESKPGLAGLDLPGSTKADVLAQVAAFTLAEFGNIDARLESTEAYTLEGVILRDPEHPPANS